MDVNNKEKTQIRFLIPEMSDDRFKLFRDLIYSTCGINLSLKKKLLLVTRLHKRLVDLRIQTFEEYYNYLFTPEGREKEIIKMIDEVSTNITGFFRDLSHFENLNTRILPELIGDKNYKKNNIINIWSAGCSTGEEPYSIAIVLAEYFENHNLRPSFTIYSTDISTKVLDVASRGIYKQDMILHVPETQLKKYFIPDKNGIDYHIVPDLKKHVAFRRINLMDNDFGHSSLMDIIFCRNVIIYFDRKMQVELFKKFYTNLKNGGYLFIGGAESLHGISSDFHPITPTIYKKI